MALIRSPILRSLPYHGRSIAATSCRLLAGLLLLAAPRVAGAQSTFYVDGSNPAATDYGPGTEAVPYQTIYAAVRKRGCCGDTILVKAGTYTEFVSLFERSDFVLRAFTRPVLVVGAFRCGGSGGGVTIEGFDITGTNLWDHGIYLRGRQGDVIRDNRIYESAGANGIDVSWSDVDIAKRSADVVIEHNIIYANAGNCIVFNGGERCTVQDNECYGDTTGGFGGIKLELSPRNVLRRNRVHHNGHSGIEIVNSDSNLVVQNLSWANGYHGLEVNNSRGTVFDSDVASANGGDGLSFEGGARFGRVENCILVANGLGTGHSNLYVADSSDVGLYSDDNIIWNPTSQSPVKYEGIRYATVLAYANATGHDQRTFESDPRFADPAEGEFHLLSGSDAIDTGSSTGPAWPPLDFEGHARVDDPIAENRGLGPVSYADRGAFEFVRTGTTAVTEAPAHGFALARPFPDPASGPVWFAVELPRDGAIVWDVLDVQGRRVWRERAVRSAGISLLRWNGRDGTGKLVGSGVYMIRAQFEGESRTVRVIRLR